MKNAKVLVIDDDAILLDSVVLILQEEGYEVTASSSGRDALEILRHDSFDAIISDVKMPGMSGIELLGEINSAGIQTPILLMTAFVEIKMTIEAVRKKAFDFIIKPCEPDDLILTVEKAVQFSHLLKMEKDYKISLETTVERRTKELSEALKMVQELNDELLRRLIAAAECRDTDTGAHIMRIGLYAQRLSEALGMSPDFVESIVFAGTLHDIGKIGIADNILLKPSGLTKEEFQVMKGHTLIGKGMLKGSSNAKIKMAESIALCHHERFDGTGYPDGLKGEQIPISSRIIIICDQYDALMMRRPYKPPLGHAKTYEIITKGDGRTIPQHFDPEILEAFKKASANFEEIFNTHQD
ncbi:MAG: response regulator [Nitrospirae bacterium]|nr:response regulator [Nitrospirota bacterium]